ncbi:MAG: glucosamine-6-phosphate deaminase [Planctomycetota bacterium]|jgi:glucosamine-6-phosphate deaminase|nr:glucosamine-6-phosphate deaminase [Planctomycetota bacterium]
MGLVICPDADNAAMRLTEWIEQAVLAKPRLVLGLACGRTLGTAYSELVKRYHASSDLTFRHATCFNTDEFLGVHPDDPRSARYFMNTTFFKLCDFRLENTHVPRGDAVDITAECKAYDHYIAASGGLDLVVLGLGHNGHVGFNEPGSTLRSKTRPVEFTASTMAALSDGSRFRDLSETPDGAITMGLSSLMEAKHVVLIATGIAKAQAVYRMFERKPGPSVPASQLLQHPNLSVVVDRDAASSLQDPDVEVQHV